MMTMSMTAMNLSNILSEDVNAPELRNPKYSGLRSDGLITRILRMLRN